MRTSYLLRMSFFITLLLMYGAYKATKAEWSDVFGIFQPAAVGVDVVMVKDLPNISTLQSGGQYVDLGYLYTTGGGRWVGYMGDRQYVELSPSELQRLLRAGGLSKPPPKPAMSTRGFVDLMILSTIALTVGLFGFGMLFLRFGMRKNSVEDEIAAMAAQSEARATAQRAFGTAPGSYGHTSR